ncbi:MAG TPA: NAD(P)-binding domain-containing protein [Nocardioides sp.]|uniref:flavin-containing monooxygenase n=1 Tax=Nocardioides sp. TaxID=35761 RepID=UPI002B83B52F|nr:FAD-dependent oxidoreductase [Nocardioides sp.]HQR25545.1 NAD(P)-binding domain-containing protein [Nocardioides sp.]
MSAATDPTARRPTPETPGCTPLDALVIGAGQAGLAVGYHLARTGMRFLLVDAAPEVGHSWATRWDSLRLFTPAEYSALPGMAFPAPPGTYPDKDQVADYLKAYANQFDLPVMPNTRVEHVDAHGGVFRVATSQGTLWARQVIVATGPFQKPGIPRVASGLAPEVMQLHSSAYRNPAGLPCSDAGKVLVVGAGNSGLQIALEVARTHQVHLAVGTRQKAISQRPLGRDLFWWLTKTGAVTRPATSPIAAWFRKRGGDLVIGTTWGDIDAADIHARPRLTTTDGHTAGFADRSQLDGVAAVIWATGFRRDYSWLDVPGVWDGHQVTHHRGATRASGLWFIGLPWQHTRGSALLGFIGEDAAWVADQVARHVRTPPTQGTPLSPHTHARPHVNPRRRRPAMSTNPTPNPASAGPSATSSWARSARTRHVRGSGGGSGRIGSANHAPA